MYKTTKIYLLLLAASLLASFPALAQQTANQVFADKVNVAVNQLAEGQFILHTNFKKVAIGEDSTSSQHLYNCIFKRLTADSLLGYQFKVFIAGEDFGYLYDGNNLWFQNYTSIETSTTAENAKYIKQITKSIYPLFADVNNTSFNRLKKYNRWSDMTISGSVIYKGDSCYQVDIKAFGMNGSKVTDELYISKKTNIPIGQVITIYQTVGQAHEILIFDNWISDLKQTKLPDDEFAKSSLKGYSKEKKYDPNYVENQDGLLPVGTTAPDWKLPLITSDSLQLSSLKGKVVILDFWFKACSGCVEQMLSLQRLHIRYDSNKVAFISVNTIDDPVKDKISLFLKNRNVSMLNVYKGKTIENLYNAPYCPALFIIDKNGKILYAKDGVNENLDQQISDIINKAL